MLPYYYLCFYITHKFAQSKMYSCILTFFTFNDKKDFFNDHVQLIASNIYEN